MLSQFHTSALVRTRFNDPNFNVDFDSKGRYCSNEIVTAHKPKSITCLYVVQCGSWFLEKYHFEVKMRNKIIQIRI